MSKFESMCDVMKSDGGVAIAGIAGIGIIAGSYYLSKHGYKAEVKRGDNSVTLSPPESDQEGTATNAD